MSTDEIGNLLGSGKEAEVFEFGDKVLKLYRREGAKAAAFREAAILAVVEASGFPAPKVLEVRRRCDRWGIVMTRALGRPFAEAMVSEPALAADHLDDMVRLHRKMHALSAPALPPLRSRLAANISKAPQLPPALRSQLLQRLGTMIDGDALCHGDFHPANIVGSPGQAIVVDWLDACQGSAAADVCRTFVLMHHPGPDVAASYVDRYAAAAGCNSDEILAWLPFIAAARLAEGVPAEESELLHMANAVWADLIRPVVTRYVSQAGIALPSPRSGL